MFLSPVTQSLPGKKKLLVMKPGESECWFVCLECAKTHQRASTGKKKFMGAPGRGPRKGEGSTRALPDPTLGKFMMPPDHAYSWLRRKLYQIWVLFKFKTFQKGDPVTNIQSSIILVSELKNTPKFTKMHLRDWGSTPDPAWKLMTPPRPYA